jgi:hypothetical protein
MAPRISKPIDPALEQSSVCVDMRRRHQNREGHGRHRVVDAAAPAPCRFGRGGTTRTRPASAASRAPVSKPRERHADRSRPPVRHRPWARASRRATSRPTVRLLRARRGTRRELVVSVRKHERAQRRHTRPAEEKGGGHPLPVALQQRKAMAVADWQCCMLCRHGRSVLC